MTWHALFTSWQFWLVLVANTVLSTAGGIVLIALMLANRSREEDERPKVDASLELLALQDECRRLQDEADALRIINADLQQFHDWAEPQITDLNRNANELQRGPNETV